jgi:O-antigen/teichoic acid export membrane protein
MSLFRQNRKIGEDDFVASDTLARNALLNFAGQAIPLLVGLISIPIFVRSIGTERFGLLSLAWVILGYFSIFDLGLGRSTTKFIAEALGKSEDHKIPQILWSAVIMQTILGTIGGVVLVCITPVLIEHILKIPLHLMAEAKLMFQMLSLGIPIVLVSASFSGSLEAKQRFGLLNAVRIPSSITAYLLPLVGVYFGLRLPGFVILILIARTGTLLALIMLSIRVFPSIKRGSKSLAYLPRLFAFGGWLTVSNVISPILVYLDRFMIASLVSMAAVAYYTAPYEAVSRLVIFPVSLTMSLFPAFSTLKGRGSHEMIVKIFFRSLKYELLALGPVVLILILFAGKILQAWLGSDFAVESKIALQILALGVLVNSLAFIPFALIQGVGRPDLTAKFHLIEFVLYLGIAFIFISRWKIIGAAVAFTLRASIDAIFLFIAAFKICRFTRSSLRANGLGISIIAVSLLLATMLLFAALIGNIPLFIQAIFFVVLGCIYSWLVWRRVLDSQDRGVVLRAINLVSSDILVGNKVKI